MLLSQSRQQFGAGLGPEDKIQVVVNPTPVQWDNADLYEYIANWQFGNRVPGGGDYYVVTPYRVWDGYRRFLRSIWLEPNSNDPALAARLNEAEAKLIKASEKSSDLRNEAQLKYDKYETDILDRNVKLKDAGQRQRPLLRREDWLNAGEYGDYGTKIAAAEIAESGAARDYISVVGEYYGPQSLVAMDIIDGLKYEPSEVQDKSKRIVKAPPFNITGDLAMLRERAEKTLPENATTWEVTEKEAYKLYEQRTKTRKGGGGWGPFRVSGSSRTSTTKNVTIDENFALKISFGAIQSFPIIPGDWYNAALIKDFQCGPFLQTRSKKPKNSVEENYYSFENLFQQNDNIETEEDGTAGKSLAQTDPTSYFFGEKGVLNRMVTDLLVAVRPTLSVTLSKAAYSELKRDFSSSMGGGFHVGSFRFGASGSDSGSDHVQKWDDASNTVTFSDVTGIPLLVAVRTQQIPYTGVPSCSKRN
jgi:hypothetical protein